MYKKAQSARNRPDGRRGRLPARLPLVFTGALCAAALTTGLSGCTTDDTKGERQPTQQEVVLQAASSRGQSPWMDSTTATDLPTQLNRVDYASTGSADGARTVSGDQVGLYGGSTNEAVCDRDKMVNFLKQHPAEAAAWREAAGVSDIDAYARTLSPVRLTYDTRVTNHGFEDGEATAFQSVLQTGTAVMVDNRGVPRVRCDSGSPLAQPREDANEELTGAGWQGLDTDSVVKVQESGAPIERLEVVTLPAPSQPEPESAFANMPVGDSEATPDQNIELPTGAKLVAVEVTPPTSTTSTVTTTSTTTTTTTPTTTTTTTTTPTTPTTTTPTTTTPTTTTPTTTTPSPDSPTSQAADTGDEPIVQETG
jgi:hypothetical protein